MSSNTEIDYGFYNFSAGEYPDKVNAIALCRGDISPEECRSCVNATSHDLLKGCPNQKLLFTCYYVRPVNSYPIYFCFPDFKIRSFYSLAVNGCLQNQISMHQGFCYILKYSRNFSLIF
jgi:hypothetical protein